MTAPPTKENSTNVSRVIKASRQVIYRAFVDPVAVARWLPPESMAGQVHEFEPWPGGRFRMSLIYQNPEDQQLGKTSSDTDTVQGRFVELVTDEKLVWMTQFESSDPAFAGEMRITFALKDAVDGTEVSVLCEDIPRGVRLEDNAEGTRSTLAMLAAYIESDAPRT